MMTQPRVILADDHVVVMQAFRALLEPEYNVVGTASDGRALVAECVRLCPDAVLLDIGMPVLNGLDAGRLIKAQRSSIKLVYLTMNLDPAIAGEALRLGASGYMLKTSDASELHQALREALRGHSYIAPQIAHDVVVALAEHREGPVELTTRQREVLQLLAEGRSMKEAAAMLGIAPRTIAFHKYRMMEQLNLKTSAELIQMAVKLGLVV